MLGRGETVEKREQSFRRMINAILLVLITTTVFIAIYIMLNLGNNTLEIFGSDKLQALRIVLGILFFLTIGNILSQVIISKHYRNHIEFLEKREKVELDTLISNLPIGIIQLEEESDEIITMSDQAIAFFGKDAKGDKLSSLHALFKTEIGFSFPEEIEVNNYVLRLIFDSTSQMLKLLDITEEKHLERKLDERQTVAGYINIDNFDVTLGKSELQSGELSFMLNKILGQWFNERGIYIRQYREDHWMIVTELNRLKNLEKDQFTILEEVRKLGKSLHVQLSMSGSFASAEDFWSASKLSWPLIDLAENRGGDQIVVRDVQGELVTYGGITKIDAQRTQTKARAMTTLFTDVLKEADKVYIMGHKFADADVLGSALGVKRFCEHNEIEATIVLDWETVNPEVKKLYLELDGDPSIFVSPKSFEKENLYGKVIKTVVIDTTIQDLVEFPELLDVSDIIAIDHHRRGMNSIVNMTVSYVEPYASSTAELVTEMLQYTPDSVSLSLSDATMLFYGIVVDSQNFKIKTGKATFAAASYLRDKGADPVLLHEITRESFQVFLMRNRLLSYATSLQGNKMLAVSTEEKSYFRREELAKAADTLLEFSDIEISIVAAKIDEDTIGVSARSIGEINVQKIMEQFGGGGHFTAAATQIKGMSLAEVKAQLEHTLRRL